MIDWSKVSDNEEVIELLKQRNEIENKIYAIDVDALMRYALQVLESGETE